MKNLKIFFITLVVILVIAIGYMGYLYLGVSKLLSFLNKPSPTPIPTATLIPVNIYEGVVSCLPISEIDTYTYEDGCIDGLKTSNGIYYELGGIEMTDEALQEGKKLKVTGTLEENYPTHFKVGGRIIVTTYTVLQ